MMPDALLFDIGSWGILFSIFLGVIWNWTEPRRGRSRSKAQK